MTEAQAPAQEISPEFFLRVNDFIEMANRIERRFDSHHAQLAMLHAFARYSAHHYRSTVGADDPQSRVAFADYVSGLLRQVVLNHLDDLAGPAAAPAAAVDSPTE
jgi:hypothetical protein